MSPRGAVKFYASKYSGAAGGLEFKILRVGISNFIRIRNFIDLQARFVLKIAGFVLKIARVVLKIARVVLKIARAYF